MLTRLPRVFLAATLVVGLLSAGSLAAVAYIDQAQVQVKLSGPGGAVRCNRTATITAKVVSTQNGKPINNQVVNWDLLLAQSSRDGLSAGRTVTNKNGTTSVKLSFGAVAGPRTVSATVTVTSPTITVRCAGGLPRTSTRLPDDFIEQPSSALLRAPTVTEGVGIEDGPLPITAVRMDRLGIDLPIVTGDGVTVPDDAAAYYPGTALPGEGSNTYLYAHAREGHFLELWQVRTGDLVEIDLADGTSAGYRVSRIVPLAEWDALEYLAPTDSEQVTLQTCLTYDDTAPRFIVIAERDPSV